MSFDAAQTAIETRLNTGWASATPIVFENVESPKDGSVPEFIRATIVEAASKKIELADPGVVRYYGTIILQVFVEKGKGTGRTGELADLFGSIFGQATFQLAQSGTITCENVTRDPVGPSGSWYQTNLRCDYRRDVVQTARPKER